MTIETEPETEEIMILVHWSNPNLLNINGQIIVISQVEYIDLCDDRVVFHFASGRKLVYSVPEVVKLIKQRLA